MKITINSASMPLTSRLIQVADVSRSSIWAESREGLAGKSAVPLAISTGERGLLAREATPIEAVSTLAEAKITPLSDTARVPAEEALAVPVSPVAAKSRSIAKKKVAEPRWLTMFPNSNRRVGFGYQGQGVRASRFEY